VKNRMLEIGAYGTVRGEAGNILTYSAFEATAFQAVECSHGTITLTTYIAASPPAVSVTARS
jgi:hypothetical protein